MYRLLGLFILGAACDSEKGITTYNSEPTATITSHTAGSVLQEGYEVSLQGLVSDGNHATGDLTVKWSSDQRELCAEQAPEFDGTTLCRTTLEAGETQLKLMVSDPEGAAVVDSIDIVVEPTQAPTATIVSPQSAETYYADQLILFSAIIQDAEDAASDLQYIWESSVDGVLPSTIAPETNGELEDYLYLSPGQHAISLTVTDSSAKTTTESLTILVGGPNSDPYCEITNPVNGDSFIYGQNVVFEGIGTDDDINNSLLSATWSSSEDGVLNSEPPNTLGEFNFAYEALSPGAHTITLRLEDDVGAICTDTVLINVNTAPSLSLTSPIAGEIFAQSESILFQGTISDSEDVLSDISFSWFSSIDGIFSTQGSDSSGSVSLSYSDLSSGMHDITVTATDSGGLTAIQSLNIRINTPPSAPFVSLSPSLPASYEDLVAQVNPSTDVDGDSISYSYAWYRNGSITAQTGITLAASETAPLEEWTLRVTPSDGYSDGDYGEASVTILNADPIISDLTVTPVVPAPSDTIICSAVVDEPDGETPTLSFAFANATTGVSYSPTTQSANQATLDLSSTGIASEDSITCTLTVSDGYGASVTESVSVLVTQEVPTFSTAASISPSSGVYTGTVLNCSATIEDIDDGLLTPSYTWSVGASTLGGGNSYVVASADTNVGDTITCTASATDSDGNSVSDSATVLVENTAPTLTAPSLSPSSGVYNDTVATCFATAYDIDESVNVNYRWSLNGIDVGFLPSIDLSTTSAGFGDTLTCTASVQDTQGAIATDTISVVIENRPPGAPGISLTPQDPIEQTDDLLCELGTASVDDDGDNVAYIFSWTVDGAAFTASTSSATSSTIFASETQDGDEWVCYITPNDGYDDGTASSASVTIEADWDGQREFGTCGLSGRSGPAQGDCNSAYSNTTLDGEVTVSSGIQYWTVPSTGTYTIEAWGAQGAAGTTNGGVAGGSGAYVYGEFALTAGDELKILVGQKADGISRGTSNAGGGGGGGSFIAYSDDTPLMVAGGGGGTGANQGVVQSATHGQSGITPGTSSSSGSIASGGQGGAAGHDGAGGGGYYGNGSDSAAGYGGTAFVNGGLGGDYSSSNTYPAGSHIGYGGFGGGGGVGHAGGGGGGFNGGNGTGTYGNGSWTGGGSSYNTGLNPTSQSGVRTGDGAVVINKL
ncbi:MAG: hypothetical protein VX278_20770 [Myxococcota bacterium]|nr:hypothetical protein [Myxococcota bacterium]